MFNPNGTIIQHTPSTPTNLFGEHSSQASISIRQGWNRLRCIVLQAYFTSPSSSSAWDTFFRMHDRYTILKQVVVQVHKLNMIKTWLCLALKYIIYYYCYGHDLYWRVMYLPRPSSAAEDEEEYQRDPFIRWFHQLLNCFHALFLCQVRLSVCLLWSMSPISLLDSNAQNECVP